MLPYATLDIIKSNFTKTSWCNLYPFQLNTVSTNLANFPPLFLYNPPDVTVHLKTLLNYKFPSITDLNFGDTTSIS